MRCEAVRGVCKVLASYWLLVPTETINTIIKIMFKELVYDAASPKIRSITITGISTLLSSPHSHVYLKTVLPKLGDSLHDSNEGVRVAVVELLKTVKNLRSIKFWDICPVEHLLSRLERDKPFLCRRITKLLFNR